MPRPSGSKSYSIGFKQQILRNFIGFKSELSRKEYAKAVGVSESTLCKWLREKEKILKNVNVNEIYTRVVVPDCISLKRSLIDWIKGEGANEPSLRDMEKYVRENEPDMLVGKNYHTRRRVLERSLNQARKEMVGFVPINGNVVGSKDVVSKKVVMKKTKRCVCVLQCGVNCKNYMKHVGCDSGNCKVKGDCGNREFIVANGKCVLVERKATDTKGCGMFAIEDIEQWSFLGEYVGEIVSESVRVEMEKKGRGEYLMNLSKGRYLDSGVKGNNTRFFNHSCDPNAEAQVWTVAGKKRVGVFAVRNIVKGCEVCIDYGSDYKLDECFCVKCFSG